MTKATAVRVVSLEREDLRAGMVKEATDAQRVLDHERKYPAAKATPATTRFNDLVYQKKARGMDHTRAVAAVVKENPELHRAMLAEANGR